MVRIAMSSANYLLAQGFQLPELPERFGWYVAGGVIIAKAVAAMLPRDQRSERRWV